ncbi:MAG: nucleotidyltransferase domain-containing protein [Nanoarchaeota archaeon]
MITKLQQKIIAVFAGNILEKHTIRRLSQIIKKNYRNTYESVQDLIKNKILVKKRIGRADVCSLDLSQENSINPVIIAEDLRKLEFKKKYSGINILLNELNSKFEKYTSFFCLIVFGSYASMTAREKSDLDLLIIINNYKNKNDFIKEINASQITSIVKINPIVILEKEFKDMLGDKKEINVGKETLKKHIIFFNSELYWQLVKNEIKN